MPKLLDPVRAVRTEAARILSRLPPSEFDAGQRAAFDAALAEFTPPSTPWPSSRPPTSPWASSTPIVSMPCRKTGRQGTPRRSSPGPLEEEDRTALRIERTAFRRCGNLAMLLNEQGRNAEAEKQFRKVIELNAKIAEVYYSLGLLLAENEKRLAEAAKFLGQAAEMAPKNARIRYNYALALQKLGRPAEAEREFGPALGSRPADARFPQCAGDTLYSAAALAGGGRLCRATCAGEPRTTTVSATFGPDPTLGTGGGEGEKRETGRRNDFSFGIRFIHQALPEIAGLAVIFQDLLRAGRDCQC